MDHEPPLPPSGSAADQPPPQPAPESLCPEDFTGLKLFSSEAIHVFHVNDYPDDPPRETITDAHRVYPGDGVAPLGEILRTLRRIDFDGFLSVELFNESYWRQDPRTVARTALEKIRAAVEQTA